MNETRKVLRKAYRAHLRSEFSRPGLWIFSASFYVITFALVACLAFVGNAIGAMLSNSPLNYQVPLTTAFHWANLIETIYLIAVATLYIWGGPAGIPFLPVKTTGND